MSEEARGSVAGSAAARRASVAYADAYLEEDEPLLTARARAAELGCVPVSPATGATLRLLAALVSARSVVEVGTGTGVSGTWLLRGMQPGGVLTTIDPEAEQQRAARQAFTAAGFTGGRARLIAGRALQVLPRLSDGAYDVVFLDAAKAEYADYLPAALRLLRPGGVLAFDNALWHDRVADPTARDPETVVVRELGIALREEPGLVPALLPVGDGLLVAARR